MLRQNNNPAVLERLTQLTSTLFHYTTSLFIAPFQFIQQLNINPAYNYQQERDIALQELIATYGEIHPTFFIGSLRQALTEARDQYRFLVVYVHCSEHQAIDPFCRDVLFNNENLANYIDQNFILWVADVRTTEGINCARLLGCTTYPHISIVNSNSSSNEPHLLAHIMGRITGDELMSFLISIMDMFGHLSVTQRIQAEERERNQKLREEQDEAFRASLAADQELENRPKPFSIPDLHTSLHDHHPHNIINNNNNNSNINININHSNNTNNNMMHRIAEINHDDEDDVHHHSSFPAPNEYKNEEEEVKVEKKEEKEESEEERKRKEIERIKERLGEEARAAENTIQLAFQLPNGVRLRRRFLPSDLIQSLYDYIDIELYKVKLSLGAYDLSSNFPRKLYTDKLQSLDDSKIQNNILLFIQES